MSCLFTADNQALTRTTGLFAALNTTVCCWARISTDRNTESTVSHLTTADPGNFMLTTLSDGTTMTMTDNSTFQTNMVAMVVGSWYFLAVTKSGGNFIGYASPAGGGALTKVTGTSSATFTGNWTSFRIAKDEFILNGFLNGNIQAFKIWTSVLNQAQIENEMRSQHLVFPSNINGQYPLLSATNAIKDLSGNGNNMTAGAANPATADGPPVSWNF